MPLNGRRVEGTRVASQETSRRLTVQEAPPEPAGAPAAAPEQPGRVGLQAPIEDAQEGAEQLSWWRRMFGV
jgi:hypothetical protein